MQIKEFKDLAENLKRIGSEMKTGAIDGLDKNWEQHFETIADYCLAIDDGIDDMLAYASMFGHNLYDFIVLGMQLGIEDIIYDKEIR